MKVDGSCQCGHIRFTAEADPEKTALCHCTDCQKLSGSAFRYTVPAQDNTFELLSGEPTIYIKTAESGARRAQAFCPQCGSPIYSTAADASESAPKRYNLRVGTLSQREPFVPTRQIWCRSALPWALSPGNGKQDEKE